MKNHGRAAITLLTNLSSFQASLVEQLPSRTSTRKGMDRGDVLSEGL